MTFLQIWLFGLINPSHAFDELKGKPAPIWGFRAVLIRFVVTSLTTTLALYSLGRLPFEPSWLTFLSTEDYYAAEIFFLPVFGLSVWLLGGAITHLVLRLAHKTSDFDLILNIVGVSMLIPAPVVWIWDWTMIALNWYQVTMMAISHSVFALWGVILYSIGFKKILELQTPAAIALALLIVVVYVLLAMVFVR